MYHASNFIDLTGGRFGRITVLGYEETDLHGNARWRCRCDCGTQFVTSGINLRNGKTVSCGCFRKQSVGERVASWHRRRKEEKLRRQRALMQLKEKIGPKSVIFLRRPVSVTQDFIGEEENIQVNAVSSLPGASAGCLVFKVGKDTVGRQVTTDDIATEDIYNIIRNIAL